MRQRLPIFLLLFLLVPLNAQGVPPTPLTSVGNGIKFTPLNFTPSLTMGKVAVWYDSTSTSLKLRKADGSDSTISLGSPAAVLTAITFTSLGAVSAGQSISMQNSGGSPVATQSNMTAEGALARPIGIASNTLGIAGSLSVIVAGEILIPTIIWEVEPVVGDVGKFVYASDINPGKLTLTAPTTSAHVRAKVGVVTLGGVGVTRIAVQVGDAFTQP